MVHLLFEQSGTFREEFIALGFDAKDYDIQNEYGRTDIICDLFEEIRHAYNNTPSILDQIGGGGSMFLHFSLVRNLKRKRLCGFAVVTTRSVIGRTCKKLSTLCDYTKRSTSITNWFACWYFWQSIEGGSWLWKIHTLTTTIYADIFLYLQR